MDNPPFEDAFPIENGKFPMSYWFSGVYMFISTWDPKTNASFQDKAGQGWIVATQKEWPEAPWAAVFAWKKTHKYRVYNYMYIYIYMYILFS